MGVFLVTGAAGFIGSHLSQKLLDRGDRVIGVDCLTDFYDPSVKRRNLIPLLQHPCFELQELDLRVAPLEPMVERVEGIFHQAAQAGVRSSWGRSFADYSSINVEATQRLLEAVKGRRQEIKRFVYASSSSVYGNAPQYPTSEEDPTLPISPYGVTKLAGEHLVRLYAKQYDLRTTSLRYFTVYGPRQRPDMGFHRFLKAIHRGEEIEIYGDGEQTRDFTYVDDAIDANLNAMLSRGDPGEVFNIGGGERISINGVLELMREITGRNPRSVYKPPVPGDVRHTGGDTSRAREVLGYSPKVGLREGITRMDGWMIPFLAGEPE